MADEMTIANINCANNNGASNANRISILIQSSVTNAPITNFNPSSLIQNSGDINNYDYDLNMCENPPFSASQCNRFRRVCSTVFLLIMIYFQVIITRCILQRLVFLHVP